MPSRSPMRTAITWEACPRYSRIFVPGCLGGQQSGHSRLRGAPGRGSPAQHPGRIHGRRRPLRLWRSAGRSACPAAGYVPGPGASNDDSLVLHVSYGQTSVLLEGDAQAASEQHMLGEALHSDLLKVGHHGSKTSTTPRFLAAVAPSYAIVSVAHHNPYGHPKWKSSIGCRTAMSAPFAPTPWAPRLLSGWKHGDGAAPRRTVTLEDTPPCSRHLFVFPCHGFRYTIRNKASL